MISNLNDITRNNILSKPLLDAVISITEMEENIKNKILRLFLSDYYKIAFYKALYSYDNHELNHFSKSTNDLLCECCDNYKLLLSVIDGASIFNNLDFISKTIIMKQISEYNKDKYLIGLNSTHFLDILTYQINYDMNSFKEYYLDYIEKNKDDNKRRKFAGDFIARKIDDLKTIDYNKYKKYILECIREYYKWKLFIKNHDGKNLLFKEDYIYLDRINKYPIDNLIRLCISDYDFLTTVVGECLHYTTSKVEIDESIINNYFISNTNESFQKKLKIKEEI